MGFAQVDQFAEEPQLLTVAGGQVPVDPTGRVILTPGVIVALLAAAEFVAGNQHRYPLGEKEDHRQGSDASGPQSQNFFIGGWSFHPAVPALVVIVAVPVVLPVAQVVLLIVADQIGQGEPIVAGDEVDRIAGAAVMVLVKIGAAGKTGGQGRHHPGSTAHEGANIVAKASVPLCPAVMAGKVADLIKAGSVPGLGDNFDIGEHRVFGDHLHYRRIGQHLAFGIPAED